MRVAAAVVPLLVAAVAEGEEGWEGGGRHTLVVCIMRFPGSSLRCVRDPW